MQFILVVLSVLFAFAAAAEEAVAAEAVPPQAKPGCTDHCGNLTIPYPFGIEKDCYMSEDFPVRCNTSAEPPIATLGDGNIVITNISLAEGEMQIQQFVASDCYNSQGENYYVRTDLWVHPFTVSHTRNKFIAVGCDTYAIFRGYRADEEWLMTGCFKHPHQWNVSKFTWKCLCDRGYISNGTNHQSCIQEIRKKQTKTTLLLIVSLSVTGGFLVLFVGISWICFTMKNKKLKKLKERNFKENGGLLLQQKLKNHGVQTTKVFTTEELEKATNNYHESQVLGEGGFGTVYKGVLPDNKEVAIKKSKGGTSTQIEQFVNEVIVLSQINHRNVVKLLGCLETAVPLLVYEFVAHGTLHDHIHKKRSPLSLELRMKIAVETAGALAHLQENEYLLGSPNSDSYVMDARGGDQNSSGTTSGYDSMQIQMLMPNGNGGGR
uniref:wall-associated receptor kinase 1-like n=1 Tax=Fragaria vesca subsp. vesca TaxID=101020 RepID=UPI0005C8361B|nr:PREDICTED: wall-associated receptor kinase 1-like [Fragaria vesca subsp. vesca]